MNSSYGVWNRDESGLPCFDLAVAPEADQDAPLLHLLGTGRLSALINRWGSLRCFTTAGGDGYLEFRKGTPWYGLSEMMGVVDIEGERYALFAGGSGVAVRYGTGYASFLGSFCIRGGTQIDWRLTISASPEGTSGLVGTIELANRGDQAVQACCRIHSYLGDFGEIRTGPGWISADAEGPLGGIWLVGPESFRGESEHAAITLFKEMELPPARKVEITVWLGYGAEEKVSAIRREIEATPAAVIRREWAERLSPIPFRAPEAWMEEEARWTLGQTLSFINYDGSLGEYYAALGGYGWPSFGIRECSEISLVLAPWFPDLTASCLRWVSRQQWPNGDLRKEHDFRPLARTAPEIPFESDNEIWLLLALGEAAKAMGPATLDINCPFADGSPGVLWDHVRAAFSWVKDRVGTGAHGLIRIWKGYWNDYLCSMGAAGRGESLMNSGMVCRALDTLIPMAQARGDTEFVDLASTFLAEMRRAVSAAFSGTFFFYGFDDEGNPVGDDREDRLHLNAQTWAVLGRCGTREQRQTALNAALQKCADPAGLTLMSRPYACPAPPHISSALIPEGEGENGGIWPQTVFWNVWALAEEGLITEAWDIWKKSSLHHRSELYPTVPYGIFNGPDCYSSHLAGAGRSGRSQTIPVSRPQSAPMSPAIAWQAFALRQINLAEPSQNT